MLKKMLSQFLVKIFVRKSKIIEKHIVAERFVFLKIRMPKKIHWTPGDKVQIVVGKKDLRSYTPYALDLDHKTFSTLIYNHGNGPGALWANEIIPNKKTEVFGPRRSFIEKEDDQMYLFFGDETSMGLCYALRLRLQHAYFEVNNETSSELALQYLGLTPYTLFKRDKNEQHLSRMVEQITSLLQQKNHRSFTLILSGHKWNAQSLESQLEVAFLQLNISNVKIVHKHYWGHKDQRKPVVKNEQLYQESSELIL